MCIKNILNKNPDLREFLFVRGFLVTTNNVSGKGYPFFDMWNHVVIGKYQFWTHGKTSFHYTKKNDVTAFLIGHAYNPFTMEHEEIPILEHILDAYNSDEYFNRLDEMTGIFVYGTIDKRGIHYIVDPSGMQSACSGIINKEFYLSSHPQLVADLCGLEMDFFVKELIKYKWYTRVMGPYLPVDMTPYEKLKRVVPNNQYSFDGDLICHERFYPIRAINEVKDEHEYLDVIQQAANILRNNMTLVSKKWEKPWISLTGGIDSNTTFAAGKGNYEHFQTFSYCSAKKETIDCDAAKKIAEYFDVPWKLYEIPDDNSELDRYDERVAIIRHNNSYIGLEKDNELRKRLYLEQNCTADVEVKSWVSETIRAYWYKHYGRKKMPKLSAKLYRNLYKIFTTNRKLAHEMDVLFEKYIKDFQYAEIPSQYPPADMHYNEITWGSWGGMNISEMKYCFDITVIYNNRKFLDLMFRVPIEKRISDQHHLDMKRYLNQELFDMGIRIVNMHETSFRAFMLNCIFTANMILP